ncbi:MAG: LamG domain-containing protein, partial [Phycisphaerales bacterium]
EVGGPTYEEGFYGQAIRCDGADDRIEVPHSPDLSFGSSTSYSVAAWVNVTTLPGRWAGVVTKGRDISPWYGIWINPSNQWVFGHDGDNQAGSGVEAGVWHHIAMVYDNGSKRIYIDGELDSQTSAVMSGDSNGDLWIGAAKGISEFCPALIDDVMVFNHALSPAEIREMVPPQLKAYDPSPADGAVGVDTPLLQWLGGDTALFHLLYFGADPDNLTFIGEQGWLVYWHTPGLVAGTTYYWRVDEKEADGTIHEGDLWSFTATPLAAWGPDPSDGAKWIDVEADLSWSKGFGAESHDVYFGTDESAVASRDPSVFIVNQPAATFEPGTLAQGTTYYWAIDELDATATHPGDVWKFTTMPVIPVADPNLVCWWKLDEGAGAAVVDYSGYGHHGSFRGDPEWAAGYDGGGLDLDGLGDYVDFGNPPDLPSGTAARSMCGWAKTDTIAGGWRWIAAYGTGAISSAMFIGMNDADLYGGGYGDDILRA